MAFARTAVLMATMTALFMFVGLLIAGEQGIVIAFVLAAALNGFAWWRSDRMVLSMHGAREVDARSSPDLHSMVADLARRAELPMPKVYLIDSDQPNAFATGRNPQNAAVAATTGLMARLTPEELAAVMAHELAHIRNRDTLLMTITATLAGAIGLLANFAFFFGGSRDRPMGIVGTLAVAILAPLAAGIVQMAISRTREYKADELGAEICGQPMWLAAALEKIDGFARRIDMNSAERNPGTAHMFIINPLHAHGHDSLFSTHPSTANRISALRQLAGVSPRRESAIPQFRFGPWG